MDDVGDPTTDDRQASKGCQERKQQLGAAGRNNSSFCSELRLPSQDPDLYLAPPGLGGKLENQGADTRNVARRIRVADQQELHCLL